MNAAKQAVWLFISLFALVSLGWFFAREKAEIKLEHTIVEKLSDLIITDLKVIKFDEQGRVDNTLNTTFLQHFPQNDTYFLDFPKIIMSGNSQPAWQITAKNAIAIEGGKKITFIDNVVVWQEGNANQPPRVLKTTELVYNTMMKIATTNKAVNFTQAGTTVNSDGMEANIEEQKVKLLKNVRGIFESKNS